MKLVHDSLIISSLFLPAVAAGNRRRLKADSSKGSKSKASKHGKSKAGKNAYSYSSMSYGPDSPTKKPTTVTDPCCEPEKIQSFIIGKFPMAQGSKALEWLVNDSCECRRTSCASEKVLQQRYTLADLYFSTNGDDWTACSQPVDIQSTDKCLVNSQFGTKNGFQWLTCNPECLWGGIACSVDTITAVDLESNNLAGTMPSEIGSLSNLQYLALEQNELSGTIPTEMGALQDLIVLDFDFNHLTGKLPDLSGLTNMVQLDLNDNQLRGTIEGVGWQSLEKLDYLDLSCNLFTGEIDINGPSLGSAFFARNDFTSANFSPTCPANFKASEQVCNSSACPCTSDYSCRGEKVLDN